MTKKWKRIAALSSAVVMATATLLYFPSDTLQNISWKITASAESVGAATWTKTESDGLTWTLYENGTLTISGTGAMKDYNINDTQSPVINHQNVKKVVVEDGITNVGNYAFYFCENLTSLTLPDSITSIGDSAFDTCRGLTNITIPEGVTNIGDCAFYDCSNLTSITIPDSVTSIGNGVLEACSSLKTISISCKSTLKKNNFGSQAHLVSHIPHILTKTAAKAATCTEDGNKEYWTCEHCGKYFLSDDTDPETATAVEQSETILPAIQHKNVELHNVSEPTETAPGYSGDRYCLDCDTVLEKGYTYWIEDNLTWKLYEDGTLNISGTGAMKNYNSNDNLSPAYMNWNVKKIVIEEDVTTIGNSAFDSCMNLTSVTIPNSVTCIEIAAFYGCTSLTNITIPESVTNIGAAVFENCSSLKTISLSCKSSLKKSDFGNQADLVSYNHKNEITRDATEPTETAPGYSGDRYCPDCDTVLEKGYTYWIEDNLTWKLYEDGTLNISGTGAMKDYSHSESNQSPVFDNDIIKSVVIEDGVTSIGNSAFWSCGGLISVTIPDSVTSIGNFAFSGCVGLTNITIPNSVTCIGMKAFGGCSGLTSITIPNSVTSIDEGAFEFCSSLTSILLPDGITSIGVGAFGNCESLTDITIPDGVTSIGDWAFEECSNLTSITIPSSVTNIGIRAFDGCSNLTSITIPDGVTSIGDWAFYHCNSLTNITIPGSVTNIGHSTFFGCKNLTSITILDGVTSIGMSVFSSCESLTDIIIPNSVTSIEEDAFSNCKSLTSITIPNSVTSIENFVFLGCSSLTDVTIPDSVTSIGTWAFKDCSSLTSITIPNSVTSIGEAIFDNCNDLTDIYYLDTKMKWKKISISEDAISPDVTIHFVEPATTVYGDVNLDGKVDILDAVFLNKYLATMVQFSDVQAANADCCQDDVLNEKDASALLQFVILLIDDLPVSPVQE